MTEMISSLPDRSLMLLGSYVKFLKTRKIKSTTIKEGTLGIIVSDSKGLCKQQEIAVRVPGQSLNRYLAVDPSFIEIRRTERRGVGHGKRVKAKTSRRKKATRKSKRVSS